MAQLDIGEVGDKERCEVEKQSQRERRDEDHDPSVDFPGIDGGTSARRRDQHRSNIDEGNVRDCGKDR